MGNGEPLEGDGIDGEGRIVRNRGMRRMTGLDGDGGAAREL